MWLFFFGVYLIMIIELNEIVQDLQQYLENKTLELTQGEIPLTTTASSLLKLREHDVISFEQYAREVTNDPYQIPAILSKFQLEADRIKKDIAAINNG